MIKNETSDKPLDFIGELLHKASAELLRRRGSDLQIQIKNDDSIVTAADLASEAIIIKAIEQAFPKDIIYSEESGLSAVERQPGRFIWVIDPLDGTTNYSNGYPFYCVSIGRGELQQDGSIFMMDGGIIDPCRSRTYLAARGQGATVNGEPCRIAQLRPLQRCFLVTGFYYMKGEDLVPEIERFARIAQQCQSIRRDGAAALDLALVADGTYDGFWEVGLQPWDVAAGSLLVEEAGGLVRNYEKHSPYSIEGAGIIAGNSPTVGRLADLL